VPVLNLEFTADTNALPSDTAMWSAAAGERIEFHRIIGATHFLIDQPRNKAEVGELITSWAKRL